MTHAPFDPPEELPILPPNMEWVIHAMADRFTVNLSYKVPPQTEADDDVEDDGEVKAKKDNGYVSTFTCRHSAVIEQDEWVHQVVQTANMLWLHYKEGNRHAAWADELMRRTR